MEQAERVNIVIDKDTRVERAYEKYGWLILAVSAIFGIGAAAVIAAPSYYVLTDPVYRDFYPVIIVWGVALVGFNIFALILTLIPFRGGERWAWYTLWILPLLWFSLFALAGPPSVPGLRRHYRSRSSPALPEVLLWLGVKFAPVAEALSEGRLFYTFLRFFQMGGERC